MTAPDGAPVRAGLGQALAALGFADYRKFAISLLLTQMGANFVQTATLWQIYDLSGNALLLGMAGLLRAVPFVGLSLVGGVLADRLDRARLIQAGQVGNALIMLILGWLISARLVEVWHLLMVVFLNGAFTAMTNPARVALIPALVPRTHMVNAIGLNATIGQTCQILGPALAGVIIASFHLDWAYWGLAGTYGIAVLFIASIKAPRASLPPPSHPWRSLGEGLSFVRQKPLILTLLAIDLTQSIFGGYRALLPVIADLLNAGEVGYGLLSAAPGIGNLLGAAGILALGDMRYKGLYVLGGVLGYSVALAVLALTNVFPLAFLATVVLGLANSVQAVPRNSIILTLPPDQLRGRVEAFRGMLAGGGPPLGFALSGAVAALIGVPLTLTLGAICCGAVILGLSAARRDLLHHDLGAPGADAG